MIINLEFDKTVSSIAGNPYGKETFDEQVKKIINYNEKTTIVFPSYIRKIAISFIQGFTKEMIDNLGYEKFFEIIEIDVSSAKLKEKFIESLK